MLIKEHNIRQRRSRHDLTELMAIYEANYIRLRQLVPELFELEPGSWVSHAADALDLHMTLVERSAYTLTLKLTYHFHDDEGEFLAPDMTVRLYQDARVAEVIRCGRLRGQRDADYDRFRRHYELDEKWHMNRFLQKWLGYCLRQGHRFETRGMPDGERLDWDSMLARLNNA